MQDQERLLKKGATAMRGERGAQRLQRLQREIANKGWDALLVATPNHTRYLTGATGTAVRMLVSPKEAILLSDFVDLEQSGLETSELPVQRVDFRSDFFSAPEETEILQTWHVRRLAANVQRMTKPRYDSVLETLGKLGVEVVSDEGIISKMCWYKDEHELQCIRRAAAINDAAYEHILPFLKPGVTERAIALEVYRYMWEAGVESVPFLAVQFGAHSALPHYYPTNTALELGEFVLMDWVPVCEGYFADTTRTVVVGQPTACQRRVYELVRQAQAKGLEEAGPGIDCAHVDRVARKVIEQAGFAGQFGHSLGHGINEGPTLSQDSKDVLEPNTVVTIEPGIYIPRWGGVRIEDTVLITDTGAEPLSKATKELVVL